MSMKLNTEQQAAADFLDGVCVVVAVPGVGKTLTMTHRIGNLVNKHGIAPESILGLTFTRNAADAMREKLAPVLNDLPVESIWQPFTASVISCYGARVGCSTSCRARSRSSFCGMS